MGVARLRVRGSWDDGGACATASRGHEPPWHFWCREAMLATESYHSDSLIGQQGVHYDLGPHRAPVGFARPPAPWRSGSRWRRPASPPQRPRRGGELCAPRRADYPARWSIPLAGRSRNTPRRMDTDRNIRHCGVYVSARSGPRNALCVWGVAKFTYHWGLCFAAQRIRHCVA